jgi:hypothetical protein
MKPTLSILLLLALVSCSGCDSKPDTVSQGRETVKYFVTQPFNAFDSAKDSLKQSEEKNKAALEQADKESQ